MFHPASVSFPFSPSPLSALSVASCAGTCLQKYPSVGLTNSWFTKARLEASSDLNPMKVFRSGGYLWMHVKYPLTVCIASFKPRNDVRLYSRPCIVQLLPQKFAETAIAQNSLLRRVGKDAGGRSF